MAGQVANNPSELKDLILRRMGAPIVNVELTTDQIYDCIQRALELYGEYHFSGLNKGYQVFYIGTEESDNAQFLNGVFNLHGRNVFAISQIVRTNVGSITSMDGNATYPWFTDFLMGMAGINGGMGSSCQKGYGPNAFGADLGYFTQLMTYWSMMQDLLSPLPDYWYNSDTEMLKVMGNFMKGDIIVCEVWTKSYNNVDWAVGNTAGYGYAGSNNANQWGVGEIYDNPNKGITGQFAGEQNQNREGAYNNRWVKDYAHCLAKELNGQILAKHQGMMLPGGVTVDGARLIEEARIEKEALRAELDLLDPGCPILLG
ncbi:head completion, neck hetero-dimeric protein [Klebsiella phage vB_Kpn_P545]|uniref:Head completion, neck hetero-dimeric protein n=1 Tax=Klebsiella phage vB_Kpn_P545 TaxID=2686283 RepID=A0A6B9J493_9CAUD|nr:head completion, neck hetero-dimeric protein [Klebsiella phage vB_Kpn_P545]